MTLSTGPRPGVVQFTQKLPSLTSSADLIYNNHHHHNKVVPTRRTKAEVNELNDPVHRTEVRGGAVHSSAVIINIIC